MRTPSIIRKEIKIQNVVCTADLKQTVDLSLFTGRKFLSSNLSLYKCGYVKDDLMVGRVSVFHTGKLISVGTKNPEHAIIELRKSISILKHYKIIKKRNISPQVQNIVARVDFGKILPIEKLSRILPRSIYEPDQFPGIIFRIDGSLVALLFASGKGILVGAKSIDEVNQAFFEVQRWLR